MKKSAIIIGLLAATALGGVFLLGRPSGSALSSQTDIMVKSALTTPETLHDFGVISMKDGKVSHRFKVTNPTDKDVTAEYLSTSCMCTTAYIVDATSQSGPFGMEGMSSSETGKMIFRPLQRKDIKVVFDPNAHGPAGVGPIKRSVFLTDTTGGKLQLQITGTVTP